jgi:hypothetical protein
MDTRCFGMMLLSVSIATLAHVPLYADDTPIGVELPDGDSPEEAPPQAEEVPSDGLLPSEDAPPPDETPPDDAPTDDEPSEEEPPSREGEFSGVVIPPEAAAEPPPSPPARRETAPSPVPVPAPAPSAESFREPQVVKESRPEEGPKETEEVFSWFTVSPQLGYLFFPKSEMEFDGLKATVEPRHGLLAKLHFDLGGDDLAFEIAPLYAMEFGGIHSANLSGLDFSKRAAGASIQAVGGELTIVFRFAVKKFFPHIGAGFHGTYLFGDQVLYGTEIYGRFPIGFTVYPAKHVALTFEIGLMGGATGVRTPPALPESVDTMPPELKEGLEQARTEADFEMWYTENQDEVDQWIADNEDELSEGYDRRQMTSDFVSEQVGRSIRFGSGFGMDIVIGIRFP